MIPRSRFALAIGLLALTGCVADGPQPPPRPTPRAVEQPSGLVPERIVLNVEPVPLDTDENGYYDSFVATVHLFADETRYPVPFHADGTLTMTLSDSRSEIVAQWVFSPEEMLRLRAASATGLLGYIITLNINDVATDRVPGRRAALTCRFDPSSGAPSALSRGSATVRIGSTGITMSE